MTSSSKVSPGSANRSPDSASNPNAENQNRRRSMPSHKIVVLGGGEAGLTILNELDKVDLASSVALVEPSRYRFDQPRWLRVGTEGMDKERTRSELRHDVPPAVTWLKEGVDAIDPTNKTITTESGALIGYEYLVVALGTTVHWHRIRGLKENLGSHGICSVYGYDQAEQTWSMIRNFDAGRALFTAPSTPHKGGSAPLKILRRAESLWREAGVHDQIELFFATATSPEFAGEAYADLIEREQAQENIHVYVDYDLIEVRPDPREAVFSVKKGESRSTDVLPYDLIHVTPPMRPPALLEESGLTHQSGPLKGYFEILPDSLRHKRFDSIFGVGDVLGVKGIKTGERARQQAVEIARLLQEMTGQDD